MPKKNGKILGLTELGKNLDRIADDLKNKDLHYATRKAAKPMHDRARANAPVDEGDLSDDIKLKKTTKNSTLDAQYSIGIQNRKRSSDGQVPPSVYFYFVEKGTEYQQAQPFMRPAWDAENQKSLGYFQDAISKRVALRAKKGQLK